MPSVGGIETVSLILANEFVKQGHEVIIITETMSDEIDVFDFSVFRRPTFRKLIQLNIWADVVLENNPSMWLSIVSFFMFKPVVTAIHTWVSRTDGHIALIDKVKLVKLKFSNHVIAVSDAIKKETFPRAVIIPNPLGLDYLDTNNGITKCKDFVFLGRLVSDKGCFLAIDAVNRLNSNGIKANLTIIGDGNERIKLQQKVKELGMSETVTFKGILTGTLLKQELKMHRFIIIPSIWREPFGIVALEGIACGCVPIVSDGGGLPDAVGKAGVVFKRGDVNEIYKAMSDLISDTDLETRLRNAGEAQLAKHDPTLISSEYLSVLKKSIN